MFIPPKSTQIEKDHNCYFSQWNGYVTLVAIMGTVINTLRPRQNGRHFADNMFKCIFLNENIWIPIEVPLKFVP